jgi:glyoxylase-like metal-dependent hydrolase (beta-lactamase superfamily II)
LNANGDRDYVIIISHCHFDHIGAYYSILVVTQLPAIPRRHRSIQRLPKIVNSRWFFRHVIH